MALLQLDVKKLEMKVEVGLLEEYKPDREVKRIHKNITALKADSETKVKELTSKETLKEIGEVLMNDKEVQSEWKNYIQEEFNPRLEEIMKAMNSKNEKMCPGYKELFKKK